MKEIDLFAVQAYVSPATYASEDAFREEMKALLDRCQEMRTPGAQGVVVFPEHIGTFLALTLLGRLGKRIRRPELAMALAALARPAPFARALRRTGLRGAKLAPLFAVESDVRAAYERTFGELSQESGIIVVAGSAILASGGALYNESLTFDEGGRVVQRTRKVNLVPALEDELGLSPGEAEALAPAETAAGKIGTLICYDGFSVAHTAKEPGWQSVAPRQASLGAVILAQPAAEVLGQRFEGRSAILERHPDGEVTTLAEARRADLAPESREVVHARTAAPWLES